MVNPEHRTSITSTKAAAEISLGRIKFGMMLYCAALVGVPAPGGRGRWEGMGAWQVVGI